jgi:RNA polymerase sigma factor (sigma-70 family)
MEQVKQDKELRKKFEGELVRRILAGDNQAFADLIDANYGVYYALAIGFVHNHDRAEDIVQEGMIRIHEQLKTLQDPEQFRSWAYTVVKRICIKAYKVMKADPTEMSNL